MPFKHSLCILVLLSSLSSCMSENDKYASSFEEAVNKSKIPTNSLKAVTLILPKSGCTGCISSAEQFVKDNISRYSDFLTVILTDAVSIKVVKVKFTEIIDLPNVIIDEENHFYQAPLWSLYPTVIYWNDNSKIESIEYVSPNTPDAIFNLEQKLLELSQFNNSN